MTVWRAAEDQRGAQVDDDLIDAAEQFLGPEDRVSSDPQVLYVMAPTTVQLPHDTWKWPIGLLVTQTNLVLVRRKGPTRRLDPQKFSRYIFLRTVSRSASGQAPTGSGSTTTTSAPSGPPSEALGRSKSWQHTSPTAKVNSGGIRPSRV